MNANELAKALDDLDLISGYEVVAKAQAMLRQQQAEIEALKKEAALQRLSDFTQEAEKTLTDEEIIVCIDESEPDTTDMIRFARAILRKAQEK